MDGPIGKEAQKNPKTKKGFYGDFDADSRVVLQPKLVIHLHKTPEFDSIFDDFDAVFKKVSAEHGEEIAEGEKIAMENEKEDADKVENVSS